VLFHGSGSFGPCSIINSIAVKSLKSSLKVSNLNLKRQRYPASHSREVIGEEMPAPLTTARRVEVRRRSHSGCAKVESWSFAINMRAGLRLPVCRAPVCRSWHRREELGHRDAYACLCLDLHLWAFRPTEDRCPPPRDRATGAGRWAQVASIARAGRV
jgi:hypothetical protein